MLKAEMQTSESKNRNLKPFVIPVFIPHEGCPHSCVFCNQRRISGAGGEAITSSQVGDDIRIWLERGRKKASSLVQVAFYGGSFTGLPLARQQELLAAVTSFIERGEVHSVRLSTRPDYIDSATIDFLRANKVETVELGVQSLDDTVLARSARGHRASDVIRASGLLKEAGIELGLQLMVGLPEQSFAGLRKTIAQVISLKPDFIRIYPVLVVEGSGLEQLYKQGLYQPLTLSRAVIQSAWIKEKVIAQGIRVVRMGLQPGPDLERSLLAGPYHPAFGELVNGRIMLRQTRKLLAFAPSDQKVCLQISEQDQSVFRGIGRVNIHRLTSLGLSDRFTLCVDPDQSRGTIQLVTNP